MDVQSAVAQRAGVGRYARALVRHLAAARADGDELACFFFDFKRRGEPFAFPGLETRTVRWCPGRLMQGLWKTVGVPPFDWLAGRADCYHFPNFILPPLRRGKAVVTIHDVSFLRYPAFAEPRNLRYLTRHIRDTVARADAIITDSAFSADEIEALLDVPRGKLHAIHLGVDDAFAPTGDAAVAAMRRKLGLDRPYLLVVGTLEPRKNLGFMMDVFESLETFDGELVLAGAPGWHTQPILDRIARSPRAAAVRLLHYVANTDLPALYSGAALLAQPSVYEGFGFPPLEAMACGTPVITSAGGSLPEVVGDAAVVMAAFDVDAWRDGLMRLLHDDETRADYRRAGFRRAAGFRWDRTARRTLRVYREVCA